ncbi:MAG: hypothetical protein EXR07_21225 [Acetobacteraceae bacterium]|nr:hypothetical protein [Acetobacteraceae bacterium]
MTRWARSCPQASAAACAGGWESPARCRRLRSWRPGARCCRHPDVRRRGNPRHQTARGGLFPGFGRGTRGGRAGHAPWGENRHGAKHENLREIAQRTTGHSGLSGDRIRPHVLDQRLASGTCHRFRRGDQSWPARSVDHAKPPHGTTRRQPRFPSGRTARELPIDIEMFDVRADGRCVLTGRWTVLGDDRRTVMTTGKATIVTMMPRSADGIADPAIVSAMADAVEQLAVPVATALTRSR